MRYFQLFALALLLLSAVSAHAGSEGGNGGIGAVCRNSDGSIRDVVLLDLVEADFDGIKLIAPLGSEGEYFSLFSQRLKPSPVAQARFQSQYPSVKSRIILKNGKFGLPDPKDFQPRAFLKGCPWEVIGLYHDDTNTLEVDSEIFGKMTSFQKEAFFIHEAVYKIARKFNATDSDVARKIVGQLFSDKFDAKALLDLVNSPRSFGTRVYCTFSQTDFITVPLTAQEGQLVVEQRALIRNTDGIHEEVSCRLNAIVEGMMSCRLRFRRDDGFHSLAVTNGVLVASPTTGTDWPVLLEAKFLNREGTEVGVGLYCELR